MKNKLRYNNVLLEADDIERFSNYYYLNDLCISFYFSYLETTVKFSDNLLLVEPTTVMTIIWDDDIDDLKQMTSYLNFEKREVIVLPINDVESPLGLSNGNHWAVLVLFIETNQIFYFDSLNNTLKTAKILTNKLGKMLERSLQFSQVYLSEAQENSFDCGVFVIAYSEEIVKLDRSGEKLNEDSISEAIRKVKQSEVSKKRKEIKNLISEMIASKD